MHYEVFLPYPPSVNNYYVKTRRGVRISEKGRKFRDETAEAINQQIPGASVDDSCLVEVVLWPPDLRKRDIDNCMKSLLDALTKAGVWEDDSLVNQLFIYRGAVIKPSGGCFVRITPAGPLLSAGVTPPD